jgi:uncharacterized protein (DUF488 family)
MSVTVLTVGHSNRSFEAFVRILRAQGIERLADVRTVPRSRHNPQFNTEALAQTLPGFGIAYVHLPRLGGLRRPRQDSRNTAWRNSGFRGYADHMETAEFDEAVEGLIDLAREKRTAVMCAEAVYWRCHRALLADALVSRGVNVLHVMDEKKTEPHRLTRFAKIVDGGVTYPPEQPGLEGLEAEEQEGPEGLEDEDAPADGAKEGGAGE